MSKIYSWRLWSENCVECSIIYYVSYFFFVDKVQGTWVFYFFVVSKISLLMWPSWSWIWHVKFLSRFTNLFAHFGFSVHANLLFFYSFFHLGYLVLHDYLFVQFLQTGKCMDLIVPFIQIHSIPSLLSHPLSPPKTPLVVIESLFAFRRNGKVCQVTLCSAAFSSLFMHMFSWK